MGDEVDFLSADKHESSLQVCIAWHAQSTQNSKFTKSLEYLRGNIKDEVDFLPSDKRQMFLQSEIII